MITALLTTTLAATAAQGSTGERYTVVGDDSFSIGAQNTSHTSYTGSERLQMLRNGKNVRFTVEADYIRVEGNGEPTAPRTAVHAYFIQEMLPDGTFEDRQDGDPDSLTVLNQPFSIQLDPATLHDLRALRGSIPFDSASAITGGSLHGTLRRGATGDVDGIPAIGVHFTADGPMQGPLPGHATISIAGKMHMDGTAFYAEKDALLVELQAKLTITGSLNNGTTNTPVLIVYTRTIRH